MGEPFDPYYTWLAISKADQPPNHYRLLAIDLFEPDQDVISNAADQRMAHLRTFQAGKHGPLSQKLLNEVAAARVTLLNPQKKAAYDEVLQQRRAAAGSEAAEESSSNVRFQAELAEIAESSHHRPARHPRSSTPIWAWAVVAAIVAPVAFGILWFASRRPAEVAKRPPEKAEAVKAFPVPASPKPQPDKQPTKKSLVSAPPAIDDGKAPEKRPPATDPAPVSPAPIAPKTPTAPAVSPPSVTSTASESPAAKPTTAPSPPRTPSSQPEAAKPPEQPAPTKQKLPVPDEAAVQQARKAAEALFKAGIDKAKTSADKVALAKRLLAQAADQTGAADRYALVLLARELSVAARDVDTAFQVIDHTAEAFEVDRFMVKTEILSGWAKEARTPDARKRVIEQMLAVGEDAIDAGELEAAKELGALATAKATGIREVAQKLKGYRQRLAEAGKDAEQLKAAQETLAREPRDPKASLVLGQYLGFSKGDWAKGLSLLAQSSDPGLSGLARQELDSPRQPEEQLRLADAWWDSAAARPRPQANAIRIHAAQWYKRASVGVPAGLVKNKVEQRLREAARLRTQLPAPPLAVAPFDDKQAKQHQQRWADYLGEPVETAASIGMRLVLVPPGEFDMGSTEEDFTWATEQGRIKEGPAHFERLAAEVPRHRVRISRPFYLGLYEVTQSEYEQVMGINPSSFAARPADALRLKVNEAVRKEREQDSRKVAGEDTPRYPVEWITWDEAKTFCDRLSALPAERAARRTYRLPTEAEWEYAARAGTATRWYFGDEEGRLNDAGWYNKNSRSQPHPVGQKRPNPFGLFDMYGNVWEWCLDWFASDYYRKSPAVDPTGPPNGSARVYRGGAWIIHGMNSRSSYRFFGSAGYRHHSLGLRVMCALAE